MTVFTEGPRTAGYLISEANGFRSRDVGAIDSAVVGELVAGTVIGRVTASGDLAIYNPAEDDGTQTVVGILFEGGKAGDARTFTARDSEVKVSQLTWFSGATANQIATGIAALKALGIVAR
jgi:hypothetical protein